MSREQDAILAALREMNYNLGLRNEVSREMMDLLDDPQGKEHLDFRGVFLSQTMARLDDRRDTTHPARPLSLEDGLALASQVPALRCDRCMGIGMSVDGDGICVHCEGTGIDLSKRAKSSFLDWTQKKAVGQSSPSPQAASISPVAQRETPDAFHLKPAARSPFGSLGPREPAVAPSAPPSVTPSSPAAPPASSLSALGQAFARQTPVASQPKPPVQPGPSVLPLKSAQAAPTAAIIRPPVTQPAPSIALAEKLDSLPPAQEAEPVSPPRRWFGLFAGKHK
ncbi:MAG: hypothetical protein OEV94_11645 [Deltaproteobacteria bacterium]|nr:hypothetical protein [Deltaproteobacteria bacterium]